MEEVNNFKFVVPQIHITLIIDDEEVEITNPYRLRVVNSLCLNYCNEMIEKYGDQIKAEIEKHNNTEFDLDEEYYNKLEKKYNALLNSKIKF